MTNGVILPCDETAGRPVPRFACSDKRGTLFAAVAGSSLAFVLGSIVNVALPAMQDSFGAGATGAQWIVNAYLLPLGALVLGSRATGRHPMNACWSSSSFETEEPRRSVRSNQA